LPADDVPERLNWGNAAGPAADIGDDGLMNDDEDTLLEAAPCTVADEPICAPSAMDRGGADRFCDAMVAALGEAKATGVSDVGAVESGVGAPFAAPAVRVAACGSQCDGGFGALRFWQELMLGITTRQASRNAKTP
jgi:hypothetical protein